MFRAQSIHQFYSNLYLFIRILPLNIELEDLFEKIQYFETYDTYYTPDNSRNRYILVSLNVQSLFTNNPERCYHQNTYTYTQKLVS